MRKRVENMRTRRLYATMIVATSVAAFAADAPTAQGEPNAVTIAATKLEVHDTRLELSYAIKNMSEREVWICDDVAVESACDYEVCFSEKYELVTLRRRLDVPSDKVWFRRPRARYVRLRAGATRYESLSVDLPLESGQLFERRDRRVPSHVCHISRLAIEIGYFEGNLPEVILGRIEEALKDYDGAGTRPPILATFGDALSFNYSRERLRNREEEIVIPYTYQQIKGEEVLRTTVDGLRLPCARRPEPGKKELQRHSDAPAKLEFTACTRLEVRFEPSALEYFFPFSINQSLLSDEEVQHLRPEQRFVVRDQDAIEALAKKVMGGRPLRGVVQKNKIAHFDCYRGDDHVTSFRIYGGTDIETKDGQRVSSLTDSSNIAALIPEMQALEYRVQCAVNLRDLYHRLRSYNLIVVRRENRPSAKGVVIDPSSTEWFDAITSPGPVPGSLMRDFWGSGLRNAHVCPSVGEGRSTYAMNPHCRADSPGDMVLLFETKAGWNQHGGPELFTFDNHDPRGGCVLLNDGTVRFIRTKQELHALRWK